MDTLRGGEEVVGGGCDVMAYHPCEVFLDESVDLIVGSVRFVRRAEDFPSREFVGWGNENSARRHESRHVAFVLHVLEADNGVLQVGLRERDVDVGLVLVSGAVEADVAG